MLSALLGSLLPHGALAGELQPRCSARCDGTVDAKPRAVPALSAVAGSGLSEEERLFIQQQVPLFVLITIDEGSSAAGLRWIEARLREAGAWGHVTAFLASAYLPGLPEEARHDLSLAWGALARHNDIGTYGPWQATDQGGRPRAGQDPSAPRLREGRRGALRYDASQRQPMPRLARWPDDGATLRWPYLAPDAAAASMALTGRAGDRQARGGGAWLVPISDWRLYLFGEDASCPSWIAAREGRDPCALLGQPQGSSALARQIIANLEAHLRGNRAPFHLGLRSADFAPGHDPEREVLVAVLAHLDLLQKSGHHLVYASVPQLLTWLAAAPRLAPAGPVQRAPQAPPPGGP